MDPKRSSENQAHITKVKVSYMAIASLLNGIKDQVQHIEDMMDRAILEASQQGKEE